MVGVSGLLGVLLGLFAVTGAVVWVSGIVLVLYFRPDVTPNGSLRGAIGDIRWSYAVGVFVLPVTIAGVQEGEPLLGFTFGVVFVLFVLVVQWWYPI